MNPSADDVHLVCQEWQCQRENISGDLLLQQNNPSGTKDHTAPAAPNKQFSNNIGSVNDRRSSNNATTNTGSSSPSQFDISSPSNVCTPESMVFCEEQHAENINPTQTEARDPNDAVQNNEVFHSLPLDNVAVEATSAVTTLLDAAPVAANDIISTNYNATDNFLSALPSGNQQLLNQFSASGHRNTSQRGSKIDTNTAAVTNIAFYNNTVAQPVVPNLFVCPIADPSPQVVSVAKLNRDFGSPYVVNDNILVPCRTISLLGSSDVPEEAEAPSRNDNAESGEIICKNGDIISDLSILDFKDRMLLSTWFLVRMGVAGKDPDRFTSGVADSLVIDELENPSYTLPDISVRVSIPNNWDFSNASTPTVLHRGFELHFYWSNFRVSTRFSTIDNSNSTVIFPAMKLRAQVDLGTIYDDELEGALPWEFTDHEQRYFIMGHFVNKFWESFRMKKSGIGMVPQSEMEFRQQNSMFFTGQSDEVEFGCTVQFVETQFDFANLGIKKFRGRFHSPSFEIELKFVWNAKNETLDAEVCYPDETSHWVLVEGWVLKDDVPI